jgi:hypothetical protein
MGILPCRNIPTSVTIYRSALCSVAAILLVMLGIWWLLTVKVIPAMTERGNALMLRQVVPALESYFSDFQEWPRGNPEEILWRLQGARGDRPPPPGGAGPQPAASAEPMRTRREMPSVDYLRDTPLRAAGQALGDAWGRPLEFEFVPDGPAKVTSLGADGILGTPDDVSVTANIMPRKTGPTRALFIADREFRRSEEAKRLERMLRTADKQRSAR